MIGSAYSEMIFASFWITSTLWGASLPGFLLLFMSPPFLNNVINLFLFRFIYFYFDLFLFRFIYFYLFLFRLVIYVVSLLESFWGFWEDTGSGRCWQRRSICESKLSMFCKASLRLRRYSRFDPEGPYEEEM